MSAARLAWVAALAGALGCSPAVSGARPSASAPADEDSEAARSGFHAAEKDVSVGLCAVDRRLAQRMRRTPTEKDLGAIGMRVILAEDLGAEIVDGAIDPFSFDDQRYYAHDPPVVFQPGDGIRTTCTYDNPTNTAVHFGEKTEDEMCFNFVMLWPIDVFAPGNRSCGLF